MATVYLSRQPINTNARKQNLNTAVLSSLGVIKWGLLPLSLVAFMWLEEGLVLNMWLQTVKFIAKKFKCACLAPEIGTPGIWSSIYIFIGGVFKKKK